jgi:hypothetical protein
MGAGDLLGGAVRGGVGHRGAAGRCGCGWIGVAAGATVAVAAISLAAIAFSTFASLTAFATFTAFTAFGLDRRVELGGGLHRHRLVHRRVVVVMGLGLGVVRLLVRLGVMDRAG